MFMDKTERKIFSTDEKLDILKRTNCKCAHCGRKINVDTMTIEHIYPINKGGDNSRCNIIGLCKTCNNLKSNFIYDLSFYTNLRNNEGDNYYVELCENIYRNASDSDMFGKCNRAMYMLDSHMRPMMQSKGAKRNRTLIMMLGKQLEFRPMYKGDIDDTAIDLIARSIAIRTKCGDLYNVVKPDMINKHLMLNMFDTSTFYGVYKGNKPIGIQAYTNIENLKLSNNEFVKNIPDEYNKVYTKFIDARDDKYTDVVTHVIMSVELEFMVVTGNIILRHHTDGQLAIRGAMRGLNTTWASIDERAKLFNISSPLTGDTLEDDTVLVTGDEEYNMMMELVRRQRKKYAAYKEKWKQIKLDNAEAVQ